MKKKLLLIIIIFTNFCYSQNKETIFTGKIIDSFKVVKNVHIINLKTKKGTFSNDNGVFTIPVNKKDSLQISAIGYKTKILVVETFHFIEKVNYINLISEINILDEIILKRHNLSGFLALDMKKTPINKKQEIVDNLVFSLQNLDPYEISKTGISNNEAHLTHAKVIRLPNYFEGFGITTGIGNNDNGNKAKIKKLEEEDKIADKILSELGNDFFFINLKIPKDKYYHFFAYCSYHKITTLYKNNEVLKIIQVFKKESVKYLEIIGKQ